MTEEHLRWAVITRWIYALMLALAAAVSVYIWLHIGSLPDRIVSGSGPGGLRYGPKEAMWLYPGLIIGMTLLGLLTKYLSRIAPDSVNLSGKTKPGLKKERTELQGTMVALILLVVSLHMGAGPYRIWLVNTGQSGPQSVFGWPTLVSLAVPCIIVIVGYVLLDRRYRE